MAERKAGWSHRSNEYGSRLGGFVGVVKVRSAAKGRWAWRERFRCDHNHATPKEAVACAEEVKGIA